MRKSLRLLNNTQVARMLGLNEKAIREAVKSGNAPQRVLVGKRYYFRKEDIKAWVGPRKTVRQPQPVADVPLHAGNASAA